MLLFNIVQESIFVYGASSAQPSLLMTVLFWTPGLLEMLFMDIKDDIKSIGTGKMMVLLCSALMLFNV